jgi:hypothetical protein
MLHRSWGKTLLELIEVPGPGEQGPRSERVTAVVNAQLRLEAWSGRRALAGRFVIAVSFLMAYTLYAGEAGSGTTHTVLALWAVAVGCLALSTAAMLEAGRRVDTLLRLAGGKRIRVVDKDT